MTCYLIVPSNYLNQCWLQWSLTAFTFHKQNIFLWYEFENYHFMITGTSLGGQWVNPILWWLHTAPQGPITGYNFITTHPWYYSRQSIIHTTAANNCCWKEHLDEIDISNLAVLLLCTWQHLIIFYDQFHNCFLLWQIDHSGAVSLNININVVASLDLLEICTIEYLMVMWYISTMWSHVSASSPVIVSMALSCHCNVLLTSSGHGACKSGITTHTWALIVVAWVC